jgi:transcriptional antiterminator NusG
MSLQWYVVHAYSGFENQVKRALEERISRADMGDSFGQILVPTEEVVEMREGNKRRSERKFFPGYVLVQIDKPAPISDREADAILQRVQEGVDKPRPKVLFEVGEVVRVTDGPFNDFNGVVEEVNYEKSRLRVSVLIFGRSTPVELAFSQVEKA